MWYIACQSTRHSYSLEGHVVTCSVFVPDFLQSKIRKGNVAYDGLHTSDLLSADTSLDVVELGLDYMHKVFVRPTTVSYDELLKTFLFFSQASPSLQCTGVFAATPYAFAFCFHDYLFTVFDSHAHGRFGTLLPQVPDAHAVNCLEHGWVQNYQRTESCSEH